MSELATVGIDLAKSVGGPLMRLKTPLHMNFGLASVGVSLTNAEVNSAFAQSTLSSHQGDPDHITDFLHRIIQNKAAVNPMVGADFMSIRIRGRERQIDCKFFLLVSTSMRLLLPSTRMGNRYRLLRFFSVFFTV